MACDSATKQVTVAAIPTADMQPAFSGLPTAAAPGATVTGTLTCTNNSATTAATQATCSATGAVVSNCKINNTGAVVTPPVDVPAGGNLTCTVTATAPATGTLSFTGTTGASNDSNGGTTVGGNNSTPAAVPVIDAVNDAPATITTSTAAQVVPGGSLLGSDTIGGIAATSANVTVSPTLTITGGPTTTGWTVDAAGNLSAPANVAPGTYTVQYQICSNPAATPVACDSATKQVTVSAAPTADMGASFPPSGPGSLPVVVAPGQTYPNLTLTCTNAGPGVAVAPTCAPTVNFGTVSAVSCVPNAPATLALNASIVCTYTFTAPGTIGGSDLPPQTVQFTGNTNATNDSNPVNNVVQGLAPGGQPPIVIDAVDDGITNVPATGGVVTILGNDQLGTVTNPTVSTTGITAPVVVPGANTTLPGVTINPNNQIVVPAGTPPGTYTVEYRICAQAAPAVCDTAIATIVVGAAPAVPAVVPTLGLNALVALTLMMFAVVGFGMRRERQARGNRLGK